MPNYYFDYNASTPMHPLVIKKIKAILNQQANPSSSHASGRKSKEHLEQAREDIAAYIGAKKASQLFFTSCATEANNMVLRSFQHQLDSGKRGLVCVTEHPCVLAVATALEQKGASIKWLNVTTQGQLDMEVFENHLDEDVAFVSVMLANNETGVIQPVKDIVQCCAKYNIFVHTDASQSLGRIPVDVTDLGVDAATFSAHKCYGPQGVGGLYMKDPLRLNPLIVGGSQEQMLRAGTQNVCAAVGFAEAVRVLKQLGETEMARLAALKTYFLEQLHFHQVPFKLNGDLKNSLVNTLNLSFSDWSGERVCTNLDLAGFCVSTGAACSTGSVDASHVLLAMGQAPKEALQGVRISFGFATQKSDIDTLINALKHLFKCD